MNHVISFKDIVAENLSIVKVGRGFKLYYKDAPLQILTNTFYTPFGVKSYENTYSSFSNFHLDCSVSDYQSESGKETIEQIQQFDSILKKLLQDNSDLFKADFGDDSYSPLLKPGKGTYPGLMKLNIGRDIKGNFETVLFNSEKVKVPLSESDIFTTLRKGLKFKSIIECSRLWYYNGRYGGTFTFKQIKLERNEFTSSSIAGGKNEFTSSGERTSGGVSPHKQVYNLIDSDTE